MIIGLTGGSGTGKSTVSGWFLKKGYKVIDCDEISRELTQPGSHVLKKIAETFGEEYLSWEGRLNRKALGALIFSRESARLTLNAILHPAITYEIRRRIKGVRKAVIDGAALHECDVYKLCDKCIFVSAPKEIRIKRIMERDDIDYEYAERRVEAQKSDEYYREKCDYEIVNDGTESFEQALEDLNLG